MLKEIEDAFVKIKGVLPKIFEGQVESVEGPPREFCFERDDYLIGLACFGYTVKHDLGEWGVTVCVRSRVSLTVKWGSAERELWADSCTSYGELSNYKSPLDLFKKLNRILLCAVGRGKPA